MVCPLSLEPVEVPLQGIHFCDVRCEVLHHLHVTVIFPPHPPCFNAERNFSVVSTFVVFVKCFHLEVDVVGGDKGLPATTPTLPSFRSWEEVEAQHHSATPELSSPPPSERRSASPGTKGKQIYCHSVLR